MLIHPALYQFAFLSGVTAVDNLGGLRHQLLDNIELLLHTLIAADLDTEPLGNHRQGGHIPAFPLFVVFMRIVQSTQVTESPGHAVAVTFHIPVVPGVGTQHFGYVTSCRRFLGYTKDHCIYSLTP